MKPAVSTCESVSRFGPMLPFAIEGRASVGARALRRGTVLRSCPGTEPRALARHKQFTGLFVSGLAPPGRAAPVPPPLLHAAQRPTTALGETSWWVEGPEGTVGTRSRVAGDRRSEVKEEGLAKPGPGDMSGVGRPSPSARSGPCTPPRSRSMSAMGREPTSNFIPTWHAARKVRQWLRAAGRH
jgi:hypothetical protein